MNYNESAVIFNTNTEINSNNNKPNGFNNSENIEENVNEDRILYKLTLRKQKIQQTINGKRNLKSKNHFIKIKDEDIIKFEKKDFLSGKVYDDLESAIKSKDGYQQLSIILGLVHFLQDQKLDNLEYNNLLLKADSSYNIKNNNRNELFPLSNLVLRLGLETDNKIIFIYCFNFILNFSFISHEYCKHITQKKIIENILDKLLYFYPFFVEKKNKGENYNKIFKMTEAQKMEEYEAYYFGSQIFKLLGNLFVSSETYDVFESIKFYEKVIYLLSIFELDMKNTEHLKFQFEYLDTLIWLIYLIFTHNENFVVDYYENLNNLVPNLLSYVKALNNTQEIDFLEKIIELIEIFSDVDENFAKKIAYSDGIKILSNLFDYLFAQDKSDCMILTSEIIERILAIFINITSIDSKYLKLFEYDIFAVVFEKLFSVYKFHHSNHFDIQRNLLLILSNCACVEDVEEIAKRFLLNNNIIKDLFKIYYQYHKKEVLYFINNIMLKQHKKIRDYILVMGAFDIIKNNIYDYDGNSEEVTNLTIESLFNMIQREKAFNIRLVFSNIYKTSIPEKIKEIFNNNDFPIETENKLKSLVEDFEKYEKSEELNH